MVRDSAAICCVLRRATHTASIVIEYPDTQHLITVNSRLHNTQQCSYPRQREMIGGKEWTECAEMCSKTGLYHEQTINRHRANMHSTAVLVRQCGIK